MDVEDDVVVVVGGDGDGGERVVRPRWTCHLHKNSVCEVSSDRDGRLYHIASVRETTEYAQRNFNVRTESDEFWERLPLGSWYSPLAYSSAANSPTVFRNVLQLFRDLDERGLAYASKDSPVDFVKRHILTDERSRVTLCNRHLLRRLQRRTTARRRYTTNNWVRGLLKALFPSVCDQRRMPTNVPSWAIEMMAATRRNNGNNGA